MKAEKSNYYAYYRHLQHFASDLRKRMTKAEVYLWKPFLKGRKMKGYSFRRQRPILYYIAYFMGKELMLVIEVDGLIHQVEEIKLNDCKKNHHLEQAGFTVLRFTNEEVLKHLDQVKDKLEAWIEEKEKDN